MYKQCDTARSSARQREFQKALFLLLQTQAYRTITVTDLCRKAGIPRNTFYRYFDAIEDVLDSEVDRLLLCADLFLLEEIDIGGYLRFWVAQKETLDILEQNELSSILIVRAHAFLSQKYKGMEYSVQNIRGLCHHYSLLSFLVTWHHDGMEKPIEEIEQAFRQIFK